MVKKILNWTGGGLFRTLGRFLGYCLLGILLYLAYSHFGLKLPNIIGIDYVNASELKNWSTSQTRLTYDDHGTSSFSDWESTPYTFSNMSLPVKRFGFRLRSSDGLNYSNTYNFTFGYLPSPDSVSVSRMEWTKNGDSNLQENFTCNQWYVNSNNYYLTDCSFTPSSNYSSSDYLFITVFFAGNGTYLNSIRPYMFGYDERLGTNAVITNQTNMINNSIQNLGDEISNSATNIINGINDANKVCKFIDKNYIEFDNSYISSTGTLGSNTIYGVTSYISVINSTIEVLDTYVQGGRMCFYDANKTMVSCVVNETMSIGMMIPVPSSAQYARFTIRKTDNKPQFNICTSGQQAVDDTLKDDNVDKDTNDMADFLNDFTFEKDGSISSIIQLPITFIESLFTDSYDTDLCFTLKGVQSCLPNGKIIWNKSSCDSNAWFGCPANAIATFKTFFNLVVGGYICYKLLVGIVKTYDNALDPNSNGIEVMKL